MDEENRRLIEAAETRLRGKPRMHQWERFVIAHPAYNQTPPTGYRCTVCGSTVGTGMDSAAFPCPGPR